MWVALSIRCICVAISRRYWSDAQKGSSEWIGIQYLPPLSLLQKHIAHECLSESASLMRYLITFAFFLNQLMSQFQGFIWWNLSTSLTCSQDVSCSVDPEHLCSNLEISRMPRKAVLSELESNTCYGDPFCLKHVAHECLSESASLVRYLIAFAYFLKQLMS